MTLFVVLEFPQNYTQIEAGTSRLLYSQMCRQKTRTPPLHPQSDGLVERMNRTIKNQLAMFIEENQRDWDQHIPFIMMVYRSAVDESTAGTPAKFMLGRDLRLPLDLLYGRPKDASVESHMAYQEVLQERHDRVHDFARRHMQIASDCVKCHYDIHSAIATFKQGDPVWLYNPWKRKGLSPNLIRPW